VPFWILAVGLLTQAILGRFRDPVDLIIVLLVFFLIGAYLGLLLTAGWRAGLRAAVAWAHQYRRKRLAMEQQLMSPEGFSGWRSIQKPDGSWMLIRLDSDESAA
jgi:hypothetical protein